MKYTLNPPNSGTHVDGSPVSQGQSQIVLTLLRPANPAGAALYNLPARLLLI